MNIQDPLLWIVLFIIASFLLTRFFPFLNGQKSIKVKSDNKKNCINGMQNDFSLISDICRIANTESEKREATHLVNVFRNEYKGSDGLSYLIIMLKGYIKRDFSKVISESKSLN